MHTISDFRELNKHIVRKPYPIPKISTMLQELEDFTYDTALDLNMGYYTIRLDPTASEMCTIIFRWGKYSYRSDGSRKVPPKIVFLILEYYFLLSFVLFLRRKGNILSCFHLLLEVFYRQVLYLQKNTSCHNLCTKNLRRNDPRK